MNDPALQHANKPTVEQFLERIEFTQELLCAGHPYSEVKANLREKFGPMAARTCARYVSRAREAFAKEARRQNLDALRWEQVALCKSIIASPTARDIDRIKASERIAGLLGLDMPARHEFAAKVSVSERQPIKIDYEALRAAQREAFGLPQT